MIQSIVSYLILLNFIFEVAIGYIHLKKSIQYIFYVPIGVILDLNQILDQSILIDCLRYVVASKYHSFLFIYYKQDSCFLVKY